MSPQPSCDRWITSSAPIRRHTVAGFLNQVAGDGLCRFPSRFLLQGPKIGYSETETIDIQELGDVCRLHHNQIAPARDR
jgi:hypothetical protein